MLRTQLRPVLLHNERHQMVKGVYTSFRQFSVTRQAKNDAGQSSGTYMKNYTVQLLFFFLILTWITLVGSRGPSTPSAAAHPRSGPPRRRPNIPSPNTRSRDGSRPRPQRVIDARSLAASNTGGQPANIIRGPRLNHPRGGAQARNRKPKDSKARAKRPRGPKRISGVEEGDDVREAEIEAVYRDLAEKSKPVPSVYTPRAFDSSAMRETWPSLPTDSSAKTAGVLEKLSAVSGRFPNGYIPPHELGKRLYEEQNVRFFNEEEKVQAIGEAKKLAQKHADKMSQRKGNLVEPEGINFKPIEVGNQKTLVQSLVQGIYPKPGQQDDKPRVLGDIMTNLRNNETYQTAGKSSQFLNKVESLLASKRPAKRV